MIEAVPAEEIQPVEMKRATIVWVVDGFRPAKLVAEPNAPPSRLYSVSAPVGADTTIVPVGVVQVG